MIESVHWLLPWAVVVSTTALLAWIIIALVCDKSSSCRGTWFGKSILPLSKVSPVGAMILTVLFSVAVVKGGGKTNGTEQAGSDLPGTNVVEQVEGDGTTNDVSQLRVTRLGVFGLGGIRPFGSTAQPWNVVTETDVLNGWVAEHEIDSCTIVPPPGGAVTNLDWWARGAHDDDFRIPVFGWTTCLPFGTLDGVTVLSRGEFRPRLLTLYYPRPFPEADLSLVPLAKWGGCSAESLFWHVVSPSNSLILMWQNVAYGRDVNCPTNFQAELSPDGRFDYLSCRLRGRASRRDSTGSSL